MRIILHLAFTDFHFFSGSAPFFCIRADLFGGAGSARVLRVREISTACRKLMEISLVKGGFQTEDRYAKQKPHFRRSAVGLR